MHTDPMLERSTIEGALEGFRHDLIKNDVGDRDTWPAAIHHYTSAAGLAGVLQTGTIWATQATCLNDKTEGRHYLDFVSRAVAKRDTDFARAVDERIEQLTKRTYVASFCHVPDELSLWRAYGDSCRGFSIAVDPRAIPDREVFPDGTKIVGPTYVAMQYLDPATFEDRVQKRLRDTERFLLSHFPQLSSRDAVVYVVGSVLELARYESMYIKHPAYKDELEHRLTVEDQRDIPKPTPNATFDYRIHPKGEEPIAYCKIRIPPESSEECRCRSRSPLRVHQEAVDRDAEALRF